MLDFNIKDLQLPYRYTVPFFHNSYTNYQDDITVTIAVCPSSDIITINCETRQDNRIFRKIFAITHTTLLSAYSCYRLLIDTVNHAIESFRAYVKEETNIGNYEKDIGYLTFERYGSAIAGQLNGYSLNTIALDEVRNTIKEKPKIDFTLEDIDEDELFLKNE